MKIKNIVEILLETTELTKEAINEVERELADYNNGKDKYMHPKGKSDASISIPLGEILLQKKLITEEQLLKALSIQTDIPYIPHILPEEIQPDIVSKLSFQYISKNKIFPIKIKDSRLTVAMRYPLELGPLNDLGVIFGCYIEPVITGEKEILNAINRFYNQSTDTAEKVIQDMDEDALDILSSSDKETDELLDVEHDAPIIRLVNLIFFQAIKDRASDIHIEPFEKELKVRYRIDGVLYNILTPPKRYQSSISSRIKVMADMDIAEKRLPQDGRIKLRTSDKEVDVRVSTVPTSFGERIVLRLLDKSGIFLKLEDIGLSKDNYEKIQQLIHRSNGIILVTGPTGSGKTTTLYATLTKLNTAEKNVITVEDPVEYQLNGIGQIQVNPKINLSFANGLRSILRQDPDIIMVGEIRDLETAEIAIHASLTGHLVFSTLHTNDSSGAITRLIDMGIEPFLVSSSVITIIAQRLVRVICPYCKVEYIPDEKVLRDIRLSVHAIKSNGGSLFKGTGCKECLYTGYRGRTGMYEILIVNDNIRRLILSNTDSNTIKNKAVELGMMTLFMDGVKKVLDGITTIEEVLRVIQE